MHIAACKSHCHLPPRRGKEHVANRYKHFFGDIPRVPSNSDNFSMSYFLLIIITTIEATFLLSINWLSKAFKMNGPVITSEDQRTESSLQTRLPTEILFNVDSRDWVCFHCGASRWGHERTIAQQKKNSEIYSNCCQQGDVTLPMADFEGPLVPEEMLELFKGKDKGVVSLDNLTIQVNS